MANQVAHSLRVECKECRFARTVLPIDDELPADVIIQHGRETGHKLTTARVDADGMQPFRD